MSELNSICDGRNFVDYWGKARPIGDGPRFHRLAYHCLDVAAVGAALLDTDPALVTRLSNASGLTAASLCGFLPFGLGLHDLGKFAPGFQDLRADLAEELQGPRKRVGYPARHDSMGLTFWNELAFAHLESSGALAARGGDGPLRGKNLRYLVEPWLQAVIGHHGQPAVEQGAVGMHFPPALPARRDALAFLDALAELLRPPELQFVQPLHDADVERALKSSSWLVAGVAVLCDWVGSNDAWFPYCAEAMDLSVYWERAQSQAKHALRECGILPRLVRSFGGVAALFPEIQKPRPMQVAVDAVAVGPAPQLFILEDLTGSGKTEAAVILAHRLMAAGAGGGIFFALPTMATANAMFPRVKNVIQALFEHGEDPSVVLAHSAPHLAALRDVKLPPRPCEDDYSGDERAVSTQCSAWIQDSRKRSLLAHVGVGTLDQALMAVMQVRHSTLRLMGLSRNVLVVDEVHAYDPYMTEHLERLLEFHAALGGSAILLSATIPSEQRSRLAKAFSCGLGKPAPVLKDKSYPLLTRVGGGAQLDELPVRASTNRRVRVAVLSDVEAASALVVEACQAGKAVCWIRNTVQDAIDAHAELRSRLPPEALTLFHARFAMGDRLRIEDGVVSAFGKSSDGKPRPGHVLVATQVVEQSLDLDFDELVTDLAPMDLLIQRAGRLHRRERAGRSNPVLHILAPELTDEPERNWYARTFPRAAWVYANHGQLWLTLRELTRRGALELPEHARALMDAVFASGLEEQIPEALQMSSINDDVARKTKVSIARGVGVALSGGYGGGDSIWQTDAKVATRLGQPTSTVRLAKATPGGGVPWIAHERFAWELSQLQVARRRLAKAAPEDARIIEVLQAQMPFVDEGMVTVVLREGTGVWRGSGMDELGGRVRVSYSADVGLQVEREK